MSPINTSSSPGAPRHDEHEQQDADGIEEGQHDHTPWLYLEGHGDLVSR